MALTEQTRAEMMDLAARYPRVATRAQRSAADAAPGPVRRGLCDARGDRHVRRGAGAHHRRGQGVASFYTMFKDEPVGEYHIGVCINPGCGILGGDAIWDALSSDLGWDTTRSPRTARSPWSASNARLRALTHRC